MTRFEWCLIALFTATIGFQSFVVPAVGLANNGDFNKLIGRFSLGPEEASPDETAYYVQRWKYDPANSWNSSDNTSSELLLIRAALGIGRLFSSRIFDIRILGVIHAILWITCFAAALPLFRSLPGWTRYAVPLFTLFVFSDVSYVAYFNSFYTDTAAFLFMRWCVVIALLVASGIWTGWLPFVGLLTAALFVIFSKPQHSPLGLLLWLLAVGVSLALPGRSGKVAGLILAPLLPLAAIVGLQMIPDGEREDALFNMIFAKTLTHSADPAADLREMGLSPELRLWVGSFAQKADSPMKDPNFARAFTVTQHHRLMLFLLHHPMVSFDILYEDLRRSAAGRRLGFLGNYERKTGLPPFRRARSFGWWSAFRSFWFRIAPWHILLWYAGFIGGAGWWSWRYRGTVAGNMAAVALVVAALGLVAMAIASFGEAGETDRHQWLFHVLTDMTMVMAAAGAARFVPRLEMAAGVATLNSRLAMDAVAVARFISQFASWRRPGTARAWSTSTKRIVVAGGGIVVGAIFAGFAWPGLFFYLGRDDLMNLMLVRSVTLWKVVIGNFNFSPDAYRPLGMLIYRGVYAVAGFHALPYHALCLILLAVNLYLLYRLAHVLTGSGEIAMLAALLGSFHSRLNTLYTSPGTVFDIAAYTLFFCALLFYLRVREAKRNLNWIETAFLATLCLLALDAKEMAATLPAVLVCYELIYRGRVRWERSELGRWRAVMIAGLVTTAFMLPKLMPGSRLVEGYRPQYSLQRFLGNWQLDLAQLFYLSTPIPLWEMLGVWALLLAIALALKSKPLLFTACFILLTPMPVCFVEARDLNTWSIPVAGWAIYVATLLVTILGRLIPASARLRAPAFIMSFAGIALSIVVVNRLDEPHRFYYNTDGNDTVRRFQAQFLAICPRMSRGTYALFLNDPFETFEGGPAWVLPLVFDDMTLHIQRAKRSEDQEIIDESRYDLVFDYRDQQLVLLNSGPISGPQARALGKK